MSSFVRVCEFLLKDLNLQKGLIFTFAGQKVAFGYAIPLCPCGLVKAPYDLSRLAVFGDLGKNSEISINIEGA